MPWKSIDPQPVTAIIDGATVEINAERWEDFSGAIAVTPLAAHGTGSDPAEATPPRPRVTILAGEYTPLDLAAFERACTDGIRV